MLRSDGTFERRAGPSPWRPSVRPTSTARLAGRARAGRAHAILWMVALLVLGIAGVLGATCSGEGTQVGEDPGDTGGGGDGVRPQPEDDDAPPDPARRRDPPGRARRLSPGNADQTGDPADLPVRLLLDVLSAAGGGPVADAEVVVTVARDPREFRGVSDARGLAELRLPGGGRPDATASIRVRREGFSPFALTSSVPPSGDLRLRATFAPAASVRVRVVRDSDGAPVAGAQVELAAGRLDASGAPATSGSAVDRAVAGTDGACVLLGAIVRQRSCVRATAPGLTPGTVLVRPIGAGPVATEIRLVGAGSIRGRVTDWEGRPLEAWVRLFSAGGDVESVGRGWSEETGAFEMSGLPLDGVYDIHVRPFGSEGQVVVFPGVRPALPGSQPDHEVRVPRPGRIIVRLAPDGLLPSTVPEEGDDDAPSPPTVEVIRLAPAPADVVECPPPGQGIDLSPGTYRVAVLPTLTHPGGEVTVDVAPGADVVATVLAREAFALPGRVVDAEGRPVGGVEVTADLAGTDEDFSCRTDDDGRFLFPCVRRGLWVLSARHATLSDEPAWVEVGGARGDAAGGGSVGGPARDTASGPGVVTGTDPTGGLPRVPEVTLRLGPGAEFLVRFPPEARGRENWVRFDRRLPPGEEDDDGEDVDGWASEGGFGNHCLGDETTGPHAPGRWRAVVRIAGFRVWRTEFVVADGDLHEIRVGPLDPGVTISGTVVDAAGVPVARPRVSLIDGTWNSLGGATKNYGAFDPIAVPSGPVVLEVTAEGYAPARVVLDATFGMPPVTLRLFRGGCAEVRARRADGAPVTSAAVAVTYPDGAPLLAWPDGAFVTDARGVVRIHAAPGTYRVRVGESSEVEVRIEDERTTVWTATVR